MTQHADMTRDRPEGSMIVWLFGPFLAGIVLVGPMGIAMGYFLVTAVVALLAFFKAGSVIAGCPIPALFQKPKRSHLVRLVCVWAATAFVLAIPSSLFVPVCPDTFVLHDSTDQAASSSELCVPIFCGEPRYEFVDSPLPDSLFLNGSTLSVVKPQPSSEPFYWLSQVRLHCLRSENNPVATFEVHAALGAEAVAPDIPASTPGLVFFLSTVVVCMGGILVLRHCLRKQDHVSMLNYSTMPAVTYENFVFATAAAAA
jgi:hypothetical protein